MRHCPSAWKSYRGFVADGSLPEDGDFNRYAARYRAASKLEAVRFADLAEATARGYTEALRVALAYTALEALETAIGASAKRPAITIDSPALAGSFKSDRCGKLRDLLQKQLDSGNLKARLVELERGDHGDDVRPLVEGIRHLVFHGVFTPGGAGISRSKWSQDFLADLGREVLDSTDQHFTAWLTPQHGEPGLAVDDAPKSHP